MTRTVYGIRDVSGALIAEHVKVRLPGGKKTMYWQLPGCGGFERGLMGIGTPDLPLYGSERIPTWAVGQTVVATEGEGACEALWSLGIAALGTVTGAGSTPGEDALSVLLPFDIVTWEDHDEDGERHMQRTAARLMRLGGRARRLIWAGARMKGDDAADFVARGGTRVTVELMILSAERWKIDPEQPMRVARPSYGDSSDRVQSAKSHLAEVALQHLGRPARQDRRSMWWPCPFHQDRSPSFKVDLHEPFYVCFGCGARGDVFTFLRMIEGLAFKDALSELAPAVGLGGIPRIGAW